MADERRTWLPSHCALPLLGEWVATILAIVPLIALVAIAELWGGMPNDIPPWYLIVGSLLMAPWLIFLERWQSLSINLPYIPVKILWLCPIMFVVGIVMLFA